MNKRLTIFIITAAVLAIAGYIIYSLFDIYPEKVPVPPLREVRNNNFTAMERWLTASGLHYRVEKKATVRQLIVAPENTVLVYAYYCAWTDSADILIPWIEDGGHIIICIDEKNAISDNLAAVLSSVGITINKQENTKATPKSTAPAEQEEDETEEQKPVPDFDTDICFLYADTAAEGKTSVGKASVLYDNDDLIRLIQLEIGKGTLTVTGKPIFMYNTGLQKETNARLAWSLTGAAMDKNSGFLCIRDQLIARSLAQGLFGRIAERGNFPPLVISVLILLVCGFWMVIPVFGLVHEEKKPSARPLRQRFLAEIRFLGRYNALDTYLRAYLSWLKPRLAGSGEESGLRQIEHALEENADRQNKKPLRRRDVMNYLKKLQAL
ncbi:MAG: hypothetical protein FWF29_10550 [Treponema sp.]|nr:hypothetical protein [Treponema sp.]